VFQAASFFRQPSAAAGSMAAGPALIPAIESQIPHCPDIEPEHGSGPSASK
jgi:hypothetical protein